jgi:hypothetical protein
VLVGDKADIHKILIEEDLPKDPIMTDFRANAGIPTLFLEVDKAAHKHTVSLPRSSTDDPINRTERS